jgi:hypothetical protein
MDQLTLSSLAHFQAPDCETGWDWQCRGGAETVPAQSYPPTLITDQGSAFLDLLSFGATEDTGTRIADFVTAIGRVAYNGR